SNENRELTHPALPGRSGCSTGRDRGACGRDWSRRVSSAAFVIVGVAILPPYATARYSRLRAVRIREHDFRWSLNAVMLRRRRLTAASAALLELADGHLTDQPGVQQMT